jgi:hypothetical protein
MLRGRDQGWQRGRALKKGSLELKVRWCRRWRVDASPRASRRWTRDDRTLGDDRGTRLRAAEREAEGGHRADPRADGREGATDSLRRREELGRGAGGHGRRRDSCGVGSAEQAVVVHVLTKDGETAAALKVDASGKVLPRRARHFRREGRVDAASVENSSTCCGGGEAEARGCADREVERGRSAGRRPAPAVQKRVERDDGGLSHTVGMIGGVGVLGLGGGVISACRRTVGGRRETTPQIDTAGYDDAVASAESAALLADVCFGVGAVGLGVGAFLFLTDDGDASGAKVSVVPTADGAAAALTGSF